MSKAGDSTLPSLVVAQCWCNTQLEVYLKPHVTLSYRDDLGEVDFLPSQNAAVIFISEADIISGGGFRRRVVKFRQNTPSTVDRRVVIVQNTPLTEQQFFNIQKFICIELGLSIIPVQSLQETAQLLTRMVTSENKITSNPLRRRPGQTRSPYQQLVASLTTSVQGLGSNKAMALLERFGTLQSMAMAPRESIEEVVGKGVGGSVYKFFNGRPECGME